MNASEVNEVERLVARAMTRLNKRLWPHARSGQADGEMIYVSKVFWNAIERESKAIHERQLRFLAEMAGVSGNDKITVPRSRRKTKARRS